MPLYKKPFKKSQFLSQTSNSSNYFTQNTAFNPVNSQQENVITSRNLNYRENSDNLNENFVRTRSGGNRKRMDENSEIKVDYDIIKSPDKPEILKRNASEPLESAEIERKQPHKSDFKNKQQKVESSKKFKRPNINCFVAGTDDFLDDSLAEMEESFETANEKYRKINMEEVGNASKHKRTKIIESDKVLNKAKSGTNKLLDESIESQLSDLEQCFKQSQEVYVKLTKDISIDNRNNNLEDQSLHSDMIELEECFKASQSEYQKIISEGVSENEHPVKRVEPNKKPVKSKIPKNNKKHAEVKSHKDSKTLKTKPNKGFKEMSKKIKISSSKSQKDIQEKKKEIQRKESFGSQVYTLRPTPPGLLSHREKMLWLQEQRDVGLYVLCDRCDKKRFLQDVKDPTVLPNKWYCHMNPDKDYNRCDVPEMELSPEEDEDLIENLYNAGSIVWARVDGWPWWPAIVDDDPNTECYYWLTEDNLNVPKWYHVTFFDQKSLSRAWLQPSSIAVFSKAQKNSKYLLSRFDPLKPRIDFAMQAAQSALNMDLLDRLRTYSFVARFKKPLRAAPLIKVGKFSGKGKKFDDSQSGNSKALNDEKKNEREKSKGLEKKSNGSQKKNEGPKNKIGTKSKKSEDKDRKGVKNGNKSGIAKKGPIKKRKYHNIQAENFEEGNKRRKITQISESIDFKDSEEEKLEAADKRTIGRVPSEAHDKKIEKGSQEENKGSQKENKGWQKENKGSQKENKGSRKENKGSQKENKGSQKENKGSQKETEGSQERTKGPKNDIGTESKKSNDKIRRELEHGDKDGIKEKGPIKKPKYDNVQAGNSEEGNNRRKITHSRESLDLDSDEEMQKVTDKRTIGRILSEAYDKGLGIISDESDLEQIDEHLDMSLVDYVNDDSLDMFDI